MVDFAACLTELADFLAPPRCFACRAPCGLGAAGPGEERLSLCPPCAGRLEWVDVACRACGLPRGPGQRESRRCAGCRTTSLGGVRTTTTLFRYRGVGRTVLRRVKYEGQAELGEQLGRALGERVRALRGDLLGEQLAVVPVPLHWWRGLRRGFNQADEIARGVSATTGAPVRHALTRRRATRALYGVRRAERDAIVRDAFRASQDLSGARVLLVDDIRTSGATLRAAARALRDAGAREIHAAVLGC